MVTDNTAQSISAIKTFTTDIHITASNIVSYPAGGPSNACIRFDSDGIKLKKKNNPADVMPTYGLIVPVTSSYTANKTIATTDDITPVSGVNDGTNWTSITIGSVTKAIPSGGGTVTDVEVDNVSVVTSGVAELTSET